MSKSGKTSTVVQDEVDAYRMENLIDLKRYGVPGPQKHCKEDNTHILSALRNARVRSTSTRGVVISIFRERRTRTLMSLTKSTANVETMVAQMQASVADAKSAEEQDEYGAYDEPEGSYGPDQEGNGEA